MNKAAILWLGLFLSMAANADSLDSLAQFLKQTRSMRADFVQVVAAPAKEGRPSKPKTSNGSFAFLRPNLFRFDYSKPFVQNIVADGKNLWLFDADLNQVTIRNQAQALGSTPATLIASANDLATLGQEFDLQAGPSEAGVDWVVAKPKIKDSSLQQVMIGLRLEAGQVVLAHLDIIDAFGTKSQMRFDKVVVNPSPMNASQFSFVPPKGADVVRP